MLEPTDERFLAEARELLVAWVSRLYPQMPVACAEDAVHEAIARFLVYRAHVDVRNPMGLLKRIAERTAHNEHARFKLTSSMRREGDGSGSDPLSSVPAPPSPLSYDPAALAAFIVLQWVCEHRPDDRQLLEWWMARIPSEEIAARLGIGPAAARKRVSRLLEDVRNHAVELGLEALLEQWLDGQSR